MISSAIRCLFALVVVLTTSHYARAQTSNPYAIFQFLHFSNSGGEFWEALLVNKKTSKLWHCSVSMQSLGRGFTGRCGLIPRTSALQITPNTETTFVGLPFVDGMPGLWFVEPNGDVYFCTFGGSTGKYDHCIKLSPLPRDEDERSETKP